MRAPTRRAAIASALAAFALALAACSARGSLVIVDVEAAPPLTGVARVHATVTALGATRDYDLPPPAPIATPFTFGIDLPPDARGPIAVHVACLDAAGAPLGAGDGAGTIAPGDASGVTVTLGGAPLDGGVDLASADAAPDLAADLRPPADLTPPPLLCQTVTVTTLAGNGTQGFVDGTGGATGTTELSAPFGLAADGAGNVYVADTGNHRVRKIAPSGATSTLAGNGTPGFVDGTGGAGGTTELDNPLAVAVDGAGVVYVADSLNNRIRRVAPGGVTTTLAGNGTLGFVDGTGGASGTTEFHGPVGLSVDGAGDVFVADTYNSRVRRVAPGGATTTLTGNGAPGFVDGTGGASGTTELDTPYGAALDAAGNLYVGDSGNHRIRKVAPDGTTTTVAGNGTQGFFDGSGSASGLTEFNSPMGVALDGAGNLYVADEGNHRIRKVAPDGSTSTVAGDGTAGFADTVGCIARFRAPSSLAVFGRQLFIADSGNHRIRLIQLP
ncbi:MAG TPA: NHL repeat-containing protein [Polyangia bacterium]|nr:NHL repeat-containing protein [Polyangia bacterium]